MMNEANTSKRLKSRLSKVRGVVLLMMSFFVYFAMSKPAIASAKLNTLAVTQATQTSHAVHQADSEKLAIDESSPLACDDCGDDDSDGDSSSETDMDEFVATLPHLDLLIHVRTYAVEDMRLSIPPYKRGLEYPPAALF